MDLLCALRDVGIADPATDDAADARLRATLAREFDRPAPPVRRPRRRRVTWPAVAVAVAVAAGAAAIALAAVEIPTRAEGPASARVLYRLADDSSRVAPLPGRYVVLAETDLQRGGVSPATRVRRTSVIDARTGAGTTFAAGAGYPAALHDGPATASSPGPAGHDEAWFAALPTDPARLRARLLAMDEGEQAAANAFSRRHGGSDLPPTSAANQVYGEASELLWYPLLPPAVRAAIYRVLAGTPGDTVDAHAVDPAGAPAVRLSRTWFQTGQWMTQTTYEDPRTGAVLAQVEIYRALPGHPTTLTSLYARVRSTDTMPHDPYTH